MTDLINLLTGLFNDGQAQGVQFHIVCSFIYDAGILYMQCSVSPHSRYHPQSPIFMSVSGIYIGLMFLSAYIDDNY